MFKKAFLSTLVSVFLTLSIFTIATAFGATTPSTTPPNGLASPTFGGLDIRGNIQNTLPDDGLSVVINDNLNVVNKLTLGNSYTGTSFIDTPASDGFSILFNGAIGHSISFRKNDPTIGESIIVAAPETVYLSSPKIIMGSTETGPGTDGDVQIISGSIDLMPSTLSDGGIKNTSTSVISGVEYDNPVWINDNLSVTSHLKADSIGTFRIQSAANAYINDLTTKSVTSTATCLDDEIATGCGFYTNSKYTVIYQSFPLGGSKSCYAAGYNPNTTAANTYYINARAICFKTNG